MSWIKRNLYFLIGGVVALALLGLSGWFLYSKWQLNNEILGKLDQDYAALDELNKQVPHPGAGKVDNDKAANEQRNDLLTLNKKLRSYFQKIAPIPDMPKVTDEAFTSALSRTIADLQQAATNSSVILRDKYAFSFTAQNLRVMFAAGSLGPLSQQLGEVKAICDIVFAAKVNALDYIRRERVSTDDQNGSQEDYLGLHSTTNELAIITPYEIQFRCFSAELGSVLAGFSTSSNSFIVKDIDVEAAPAIATEAQPMMMQAAPAAMAQPAQPQPSSRLDYRAAQASAAAAFARRYGIAPGGNRPTQRPMAPPPPPVASAPTAQPTVAKSNQPVLDERLLRVTLLLNIVKLLPPAK